MMAWLRLCVLLVWLLVGGSVAALLFYGRLRSWRDAFVIWGFRQFLRIARVTVVCKGQVDSARPLLLVSNHVSYMDIPVLASLAAVRFTPKADIAGWPVIGYLCRIAECVFIDRKASSTGRNKRALERSFEKKQLISLFAEGTTGDGKRILPFRSSYFSLAFEEGERAIPVQAATIRYTHVNSIPVDSAVMPRIAWYGDMYLLPHILDFLRLGNVRVEVTFHGVMSHETFNSRKEMAAHCHALVRDAR